MYALFECEDRTVCVGLPIEVVGSVLADEDVGIVLTVGSTLPTEETPRPDSESVVVEADVPGVVVDDEADVMEELPTVLLLWELATKHEESAPATTVYSWALGRHYQMLWRMMSMLKHT